MREHSAEVTHQRLAIQCHRRPNTKLNTLVKEVRGGIALLNMAHGFKDATVAKQVRSMAVESLNKSLPDVQHSSTG